MSLEAKAHGILQKEYRVVHAGPFRRLDNQTLQHSHRVADVATELGQHWHLEGRFLEEVRVAALLHDTGKVHCDPEVLWFPGKLPEEAKGELHLHPLDSERIAVFNQIPPRIRRFIRQHHEMVDGTGYPDGLAGQDVSIGASIIKIADEWDRMRNPVPWRDGVLSPYEAAEEIRSHAGKRYPRMLVDTVFESWYKQKGYNGKA
jgi:HD-GYP domain-containing protein (c-di-GMP phosphodiesterase class II)